LKNKKELPNIRILALNGGGVRGLYTISVLAEFERILSNGDESYSIAQHFDLIAGTSIGGLLALGLADGKTARTLKTKMLQHATTIFPPRPKYCPKLIWNIKNGILVLFGKRYEGANLHQAFADIVGDDRTIRHLKRRVLIPTVNISTGKPVFIKTRHNALFFRDDQLNLIDVARATSAAPTYFKPHFIQKLSAYFVDGGLVANNPSYVAYHEAMTDLKDEFNIQSANQIYILNIGTMGGEFCINPENIEKNISGYLGLWGMGEKLVETVMVGNQWMHHFMANRALSKTNHIVLDDALPNEQSDLITLDNSQKAALRILDGRGQQRAMFAISDSSLNLREKFFNTQAPEFIHPKDKKNVKSTQMESTPVSG
jgi:patatin-like phospholipase/acyl hydrolase